MKKTKTFYFPTIFDTLRQSGGITEYSDIQKIKVMRKNNLSNGGAGRNSDDIKFWENHNEWGQLTKHKDI